jgi:uncharacterized protein YcgL (UPF0745 family)
MCLIVNSRREINMIVDIYQSRTVRDKFVFVEKGASLGAVLADKLPTEWEPMVFFKTIEVKIDDPLIAADPTEIIRNIEKYGFHLQGAKVKSSVSEAGAMLGGGVLLASLGLGPLGAIIGALGGLYLAKASEEEDSK